MTTREDEAAAIRDRLAALRRADAETRAQARALTVAWHDEGASEYHIADALGVTRMTVRSWLGKKPRASG